MVERWEREASVKRERESEFSARFLSERRLRQGARVSAAERQKRARQQRIRILQDNQSASFMFYTNTQVKLPKPIWFGKRAFTFGHAGGIFPTKTRMKLPVQIFPVKRIYATLERSVSSIRKSGLCQVGNFTSRFYLRVIVLFPR